MFTVHLSSHYELKDIPDVSSDTHVAWAFNSQLNGKQLSVVFVFGFGQKLFL